MPLVAHCQDKCPERLNCATHATFGANMKTKMRWIERPGTAFTTRMLRPCYSSLAQSQRPKPLTTGAVRSHVKESVVPRRTWNNSKLPPPFATSKCLVQSPGKDFRGGSAGGKDSSGMRPDRNGLRHAKLGRAERLRPRCGLLRINPLRRPQRRSSSLQVAKPKNKLHEAPRSKHTLPRMKATKRS